MYVCLGAGMCRISVEYLNYRKKAKSENKPAAHLLPVEISKSKEFSLLFGNSKNFQICTGKVPYQWPNMFLSNFIVRGTDSPGEKEKYVTIEHTQIYTKCRNCKIRYTIDNTLFIWGEIHYWPYFVYTAFWIMATLKFIFSFWFWNFHSIHWRTLFCMVLSTMPAWIFSSFMLKWAWMSVNYTMRRRSWDYDVYY